jgi:methionyl-tRNA synthetase
LLRLFLASVRPEEVDTNFPKDSMRPYLQERWIDPLQNWLAALGQALTTESSSKAPESDDWSEEHNDFQDLLDSLRKQVGHAYSLGKLQSVTRSLLKLVEEATHFHLSQEALAGIPELASQRATGLALELAAAQLLAQLSAPLTPKFATQLWKHLGQRGALYWPDSVDFVPAGQRVLAAAGLSSRRYFPQL